MPPRALSDEALLGRLLEAFAELGFEGASMRAVCRRLGVSHNLLYERFGSKEQMWFAAVDHGFHDLAGQLLDAAIAAGDDGFAQARATMLRFVEATAAQPALLRILNQEAARPSPRYDYMFDNYIGPIQQAANELLRRLQAEGRARPGPISTSYFFLTTHGLGALASQSTMLDRLGDPETTLTDAATTAVDIILDGLRMLPEGASNP